MIRMIPFILFILSRPGLVSGLCSPLKTNAGDSKLIKHHAPPPRGYGGRVVCYKHMGNAFSQAHGLQWAQALAKLCKPVQGPREGRVVRTGRSPLRAVKLC